LLFLLCTEPYTTTTTERKNMNYNEYIETIRREIQIKMGDEFSITISQVNKNNGIMLKGISINDKNNSLSPVFYLNDQYQVDIITSDKKTNRETRIRETVGDIIRLYYDHCVSANIDLELFKSYANIKDKVLFRLINFEKNKELLEEIPHKQFYDLAMVFYCDVKNDFFENGSILLNNLRLEKWGVSIEEVFDDAMQNTPKLLKPITQTMVEVMKDLLEIRIYEKYGEDKETKILVKEFLAKEYRDLDETDMKLDNHRYKMYVATNTQKLFGAAVLLYPNFIKDFANQVESDLYIFPSSVHEIIISPADQNQTRAELLKMVCEINATQVSPDEILADTVYHYHRAMDIIEVIK